MTIDTRNNVGIKDKIRFKINFFIIQLKDTGEMSPSLPYLFLSFSCLADICEQEFVHTCSPLFINFCAPYKRSLEVCQMRYFCSGNRIQLVITELGDFLSVCQCELL